MKKIKNVLNTFLIFTILATCSKVSYAQQDTEAMSDAALYSIAIISVPIERRGT